MEMFQVRGRRCVSSIHKLLFVSDSFSYFDNIKFSSNRLKS